MKIEQLKKDAIHPTKISDGVYKLYYPKEMKSVSRSIRYAGGAMSPSAWIRSAKPIKIRIGLRLHIPTGVLGLVTMDKEKAALGWNLFQNPLILTGTQDITLLVTNQMEGRLRPGDAIADLTFLYISPQELDIANQDVEVKGSCNSSN